MPSHPATAPPGSAPLPTPLELLAPRRTILGMSAILLPFEADGSIAWDAFAAHVARTAAAGIIPAVNMDTGYVNLIDDDVRRRALAIARSTLGKPEGRFGGLVAGAFVADRETVAFDEPAYARQLAMIAEADATPVIFPSWGLCGAGDAGMLEGYRRLAAHVPQFIGFELSPAFIPCGRILSLEAYEAMLAIPGCIGAKHSSLSRRAEWDRLRLRDRVRPDFHVFTGNDLAIDMVRYGSDWLLGLSTACPEAFAVRDRWWSEGDSRFDELDDALQALGDFAFRPPVPAYKHSMAMTLALRGLIACDEPHPKSPRRPDTDRPILETIIRRIDAAMHAE